MINKMKIIINNLKRRNNKKIKEIIENKNEIKLFKSYTITFNLIDGSSVTTDPTDFKTFKKRVNQDIRGVEFREPNESDYKEYFDNILYLLNNINESNYFKVIIKGEMFNLEPERIVNAFPNIEK